MDTPIEDYPNKSYALSGKIMLTAIVVLCSVLILMVFLHLYARWYIERARRRQIENRRRSSESPLRTRLVFYAAPDTPASGHRGLDPSVLASLPVMDYAKLKAQAVSSDCNPDSLCPSLLECAVCLSEFEDGEKVRLLPKCNHSFHLDCIDMWFHSHATCPLCRSPVEKFVAGPIPLRGRRKELGNVRVRIEVPRTEFEAELVASSPASYRSAPGRLLSFKRILSMGRRSAAVSPSGAAGPSCDSAELDLECGASNSTRPQSRIQTPR